MLSEQWQCSSCKLWNTYKRTNCQACFTLNKSPEPKLRLVQGLHRKIKPEAQILKDLLVFGYANSCCIHIQQIIPTDLIQLVLLYYDEIMHWKIEKEDLKQHEKLLRIKCKIKNININNNNNKNIDDKYYGHTFFVENIQIKCSFDLNSRLYGKPGFNSFTFHVFLPFYVKKCILYLESYCAQNRAEFKNRATFINHTISSPDMQMFEFFNNKKAENVWCDTTHYMKLNWNDWNNLDFNYHIDILSIIYANNYQKNYFKNIKMPKYVQFKWYIDGKFMEECQNAIGSQIFFSDTFDSISNNWCLRLQPMGSSLEMKTKDRKCLLSLKLLMKPNIDQAIIGNCIITNSFNNNQMEKHFNFGSSYGASLLIGELFPSIKLFEMTSFTINCTIQIMSVGNGMSQTDLDDKYSHIFY